MLAMVTCGLIRKTCIEKGIDVPPTADRTMSDIIDASLAQPTFTVTLLAIAAGIALVLGVVGLYGVISYIVTQRTAEIGVRLALGARPARVCAMVLRQGVTVASVGEWRTRFAAIHQERDLSGPEPWMGVDW